MSKLDLTQIKEELARKNLTLAENSPEYENLNSQIIVECSKNHKIHTTLKSVRLSNFTCPVCVGEKTKGFSEMPTEIPPKKGHRIIGFDNATYNMGVSVFDSGKLVYFKLLKFDSTNHIRRLNQIRDAIENQIIPI